MWCAACSAAALSSLTESFRRLRSAGVLAGESIDAMRMRRQLYADYLKKHLL